MISISKNVYYEMLDGIVNKYNNRTIKIKSIDAKTSIYIGFGLENSDMKTFLQKVTFKIVEKKLFIIKVENTVTLIMKKWLENCMKKNCKRQVKQSLKIFLTEIFFLQDN